MAGRSHVIARTFDRVCRVLERLGYLDGDAVTPDGQRLGRLYTELDLLAAECLRRGLWDGLSPAELAACVSALSFESRQADDTQPPRLPKGRVPEALAATVRTWGSLTSWRRTTSCRSCASPTSASPGPPTAGRAERAWKASWTNRPTSPPATSSAPSSS